MINFMEMEKFFMQMERLMKASLLMIKSTEKVRKCELMALIMLENILLAKSMGLESSSEMMELFMKDNFQII